MSKSECFGKQHKDVLRSVEKLIAELADTEFSQRNFAPSDYKNSRGKTFAEYRLTHDGFALPVLGQGCSRLKARTSDEDT